MEAVRFALAAERVTNLMDGLNEILTTDDSGLAPDSRARLTRLKLDARKEAAEIHAFLMPPDEETEDG